MAASTVDQVDQCCRAIIGIIHQLQWTITLTAEQHQHFDDMEAEATGMLGDPPLPE